ncbi:MAG TPA: AI-2E family transporter [Kofleriaceae bacterium]|nr:AI-2E family transporter [Kofleriaceae bacterium]
MIDDAPSDSDPVLAREEHAALGWAALLASLVLIWLVLPIGVGILLGTCLAFMAQSSFERLERRLGSRWAALTTVVLSSLTLAGVLGGLAWLLVDKGTILIGQLMATFERGGFADEAVGSLARLTERFGMSRLELENHARDLAAAAATRATDVAEAIAATTGSALLALFFATLSMYYILRNWGIVARSAQETFPLRPQYTAALFDEFRQVCRTTLLGTAGTALAQGVFATIGYVIAGVPQPAFFGALTALASFVPAVGVLLVLIPVGLGLVLSGSPGHAIAELAWGLVLVVGVSDYVIRPRIVRGESKVPALVTFAALFGGVEVLGFKGLIVGPVLMALAITILRLYAAETRKRRSLLVEPTTEPAS